MVPGTWEMLSVGYYDPSRTFTVAPHPNVGCASPWAPHTPCPMHIGWWGGQPRMVSVGLQKPAWMELGAEEVCWE